MNYSIFKIDVVAIALLAGMAVACSDKSTPGSGWGGSGGAPLPEQQTEIRYEVNSVSEIDILFVIDNSNSMQEEQDNLRAKFSAFMQVL